MTYFELEKKILAVLSNGFTVPRSMLAALMNAAKPPEIPTAETEPEKPKTRHPLVGVLTQRLSTLRRFGLDVRWRSEFKLRPFDPSRREFKHRVLSLAQLTDHFVDYRRNIRMYVAGPMSGRPNYNFEAFGKIIKQLRKRGFTSIHDPRQHVGNNHGEYMWEYLVEILLATDLIVALPRWDESYGATIEVLVAAALGIPVVEIHHNTITNEVKFTVVSRSVIRKMLKLRGTITDLLSKIVNEELKSTGEPQPSPSIVPQDSLAKEAEALVQGARRQAYGHPYDDFSRTASILNVFFPNGITKFDAKTIPWLMFAVKLSRELHAHKRDNLVDLIGYILTLDAVITAQSEKGGYPVPSQLQQILTDFWKKYPNGVKLDTAVTGPAQKLEKPVNPVPASCCNDSKPAPPPAGCKDNAPF